MIFVENGNGCGVILTRTFIDLQGLARSKMNITEKLYIVIVRCELVAQRCSGYFCEKAFHERSGGFAAYPKELAYRTLYITCGGCCGRALQRKLSHLARRIRQKEQIGKEQIVVQLSSCITRDNHHGPPCPHLDYIKTLVRRLNIDLREDTRISPKAEERRKAGEYADRSGCSE